MSTKSYQKLLYTGSILFTQLLFLLQLSSQTLLRDTYFNSNALTTNSEVRCIEVLNDASNKGKVILGGSFNNYNGHFGFNGIVRVNPDGNIDPGFTPPSTFVGNIYTVAVQPWDNKIVIGGTFTVSASGVTYNNLARLGADGKLDITFNPTGVGTDGAVWKVLVLDPEKQIVIGGVFNSYQGTSIRAGRNQGGAIIVNENGTLFKNLKVGDGEWTGGGIYCMSFDYNGQILIGGEFGEIDGVLVRRAARLNRDGSFDPSFLNRDYKGSGPGGTVYSIIAQPDNKILIGGAFDTYIDMSISQWTTIPRKKIARLNTNGYLDNTFNYASGYLSTGFNSVDIKDFLVDVQDRIIIVGRFTDYMGKAVNNIIRLLRDGSYDPTFNVGTGFNNLVYDIAFQNWRNNDLEPEAHFIVGGLFTSYNSYNGQQFAVRLINKEIVVLGKYIKNFSCVKAAKNKINVKWNAIQSSATYTLERSYDGTSYERVISYQNIHPNTNWSHTDIIKEREIVYYRVSVSLKNETGLSSSSKPVEYSDVMQVKLSSALETTIRTSGNIIYIHALRAFEREKLFLYVYTLAGQQLLMKKLEFQDKYLDATVIMQQPLNNSFIVLSNLKGEVIKKIYVK